MKAASSHPVLGLLLLVSCTGEIGGSAHGGDVAGKPGGGPNGAGGSGGGTNSAGGGGGGANSAGGGTTGTSCGTAVPGRAVLRRLNRDEYTNSLRELLGITSSPGDLLPEEGTGPEGFNTNGDYLAISVPFISQLLNASSAAISEGLSKSRATLLACATASASPAAAPCAREIVARFGKRAFRRPMSTEEIDAHTKIVTDAKASGLDDDTSIRFGLQSMLVSPFFLLHVVNESAPNDPKAAHRLDDYELATRLASFLRVSIPDPTLLDLADKKQLNKPEILAQQIKRLLGDATSSARFAEAFGAQWLKTRQVLTTVNPPPSVIATFDDELRQSMKRETDALFENLVRSDVPPMEALTADYSFINARMAKHYGISGVTGTAMTRKSLAGTNRKGALSHASVLAATTHSGQTSPIARGYFVLSQLMCLSLSVPANENIPSIEQLIEESANLTVRQVMEKHLTRPDCAGCHREMDPIGLAFEAFDPIGRHRTVDEKNRAIDTSGDLPGAGPFRDHMGLIDLLSKDRRQQVMRCLTTMMMSYAVGRTMGPADQCAIDKIADGLADTHGISELVTRIASSDQFRSQGGAQKGGAQ